MPYFAMHSASVMKITTWNVNGIRSLPNPISEVVRELDCDILCLQETKVPRDSLQSQVAFVEGFLSFFSFCRKKAGYSGVVTYSSSDSCPHSSEETFASSACESDVGISDYEGRVMITRHTFRPRNCPSNYHTSDLYLFNMYCPRFDPENPERFSYKMKFHRLMERKVRELLSRGSHVLLTGDFNVSLSRKDHCDPDSIPNFDEQEHRVWLRNLLAAGDSSTESPILIDLFRHFHADEEKAYTCWNTKISARETNFGTRIDYFMADKALVDRGFFLDCIHLPEYMGSDHCPVQCMIDSDKFQFLPPTQIPLSCAKFMPELRGSQTSLKSFLIASEKNIVGSISNESKSTVTKKRVAKTVVTLEKFLTPSSGKTTKNYSPVSATVESETDLSSGAERPKKLKTEWASIFKPPPPAPLCKGHSESCIARTVKKKGPNLNRKFWVCARPEGHKEDSRARCDHFQWQ